MKLSAPLFAAAAAATTADASSRSPLVIVPGTGGNQLEAKLDKPSKDHWWCSQKSDWYTIWLSATQLLPGAIDCWVDNIALAYDETSDSFSNAPGVETRVPDFGGTSSFESLDPSLSSVTGYFKTFIDAFVDAGWARGTSIRGAPYDFRYAPVSDKDGFVEAFVSLIEETYAANGETKVTLVSHSMGCLQSLYMLNHQSQEWKDKYIHAWTPIAGVFAGTINEMELFASGSAEGIPGVSASTVRDEQRSYESNFWLLPVPSVFGDDVLVVSPEGNFTAADLATGAYFDAVDYSVGAKIYPRVKDITSSFTDPGVDVSCFYGTGVDTPERYEYSSGFDKSHDTVNGDGDGTVNRASLDVCKQWTEQVKTFDGVSHSDIVSNDDLIASIVQVATLGESVGEGDQCYKSCGSDSDCSGCGFCLPAPHSCCSDGVSSPLDCPNGDSFLAYY